MKFRAQVSGFCVAAACVCFYGWAAEAQSAAQDLAGPIRACEADASRCNADTVPADRVIRLSNGVESQQNYEWLREGLKAMKTGDVAARHRRAQQLLQHLQEDTPTPSGVAQDHARKQADAVLADVEFAKAKPSFFSKWWEALERWLDSHARIPGNSTRGWIRLLLEVLLFGVPLLLLLLWLLRQIREERRLALEGTSPEPRTPRTRDNWLKEAESYAAQQEWREAVHALYWYSIGALEQQRVVAPSRTRTPREYLTLLQPGSARASNLRELTLLLEVVWYGYRESSEGDYRRAQQLVHEVSAR